MSTLPEPHPADAPTTLHLNLPDWAQCDTVWQRPMPFALWDVGEQPLLFHWLDFAVDSGVRTVVLYAADRPADIRNAMQNATLWPIEWDLRPTRSQTDAPPDALFAGSLPPSFSDAAPAPAPLPQPADGWALLAHYNALINAWLAAFHSETHDLPSQLAIGRYCQIHPKAKLVPPFWIGEGVLVGPDCTIGPNVTIGNGAILSGGNALANAHVAPATFLGPETDLQDAFLEGACLLNLKHRARVSRLDPFIASPIDPPANTNTSKPNLADRWLAFRLWLRWSARQRTLQPIPPIRFQGVDGRNWTIPAGMLWRSRLPLLKAVWQGKIPLVGLPPRPPAALAHLDPDWQTLLRNAPVGAFSYADTLGAPIGSFDEALHAIFGLLSPDPTPRNLTRAWVQSCLHSPPPDRPLTPDLND